MPWKERASSYHTGFVGFLFNSVFRFFQFVMAITVCGLYGVDLNNARKAGKYADGKWVFAEITAGIAGITALAFMIPFLKTYRLFPWDAVVL
jgi:hypothetical protein